MPKPKTYAGTVMLEEDAAAVLGTNVRLMQLWRQQDRGPRFCKLVGSVRYRYADLVEFIWHHTIETRDSRRPRNAASA